jgi:hypothetical protein
VGERGIGSGLTECQAVRPNIKVLAGPRTKHDSTVSGGRAHAVSHSFDTLGANCGGYRGFKPRRTGRIGGYVLVTGK